jgi:hypothetical protein
MRFPPEFGIKRHAQVFGCVLVRNNVVVDIDRRVLDTLCFNMHKFLCFYLLGEKRNVYRLLVRKAERKRPRHRWIDNIKMDLLEIELCVVDWIGLAQDRYRWRALVNSVMNLRVPENAGNLPSGCTT